jgi:hypothetical protein
MVLTAPSRSPRSTRDTIRQREDQQRDLISALLHPIVPHGQDLAARLDRCQQAREARRGWRDLRHAASNDYPYQCRSFACWACRRTIIRRWSDKAGRRFSGAANEECSKVDIALPCSGDVEPILDAVVKARSDFGNMRAAAYRQPAGWRWNSVVAFGTVKVAASIVDSEALLTPRRHAWISRFSTVAPAGTGLWQLCVRLAVHHPHLDRPELARAIMHQWPEAGRVVVHRFEDHQSAADNAAAIVGNALERFEQGGFYGADSRRPTRWHAELQSWLFGLRRGLQALGISSRPQRDEDVACANDVQDCMVEAGQQGGEIEPMPVLF